MHFVGNKLCVTFDLLVGEGFMKTDNYHYHRKNKNIEVLGRGAYGSGVDIVFDSLPARVKAAIIEKVGNPYELARKQPILGLIVPDGVARNWFAQYALPDGRKLPNGLLPNGNYDAERDYIGRMVRQAEWLNMMQMALKDKKLLKDILMIESVADFYASVIAMHQEDRPINPKLPTSYDRLKQKYNKYVSGGYETLVEVHRFTNNNARKVDDKIEHLIVALYCQTQNPYMADVCKQYARFMAGELTVVDVDNGEVFDAKDFYVKGEPYVVSEATVKYYLQKSDNAVVAAKMRRSDFEYRMTVRPHHVRKAPIYALSKITMDDTSSPFKMHNGKRPATYKIFDVASQALIALAMVKEESASQALVRMCLRNMLRTVVQNGWGMPHQIEVENAINKSLVTKKDEDGNKVADVLSAGAFFPSVYFCRPNNPQEKAAERFIKTIKYSYQKRREGFQFRPFAMLDAHRMNKDRDKVTFDFDEILAMETEDAEAYNNELHPNQDEYPGKTRWQVLQECQNPELPKPVLPLIVPFVGDKVPHTTISRGYLSVKGVKMQLPDGALAAQLAEETVTAYYLPETDGSIAKAYLYQDAEYLCEAIPVLRYNTAMAEATEDDYEIRKQQQAYIKGFDEAVEQKLAKVPKVGVLETARLKDLQRTVDAGVLPANEVQPDEPQANGKDKQTFDVNKYI